MKSSRKVDTFLDDSDLTSIDPPSLPATLSSETEGKESKSLPGVLPLWDPTLWSSFNSWTDPDPNAPAAPNGLTHHLWTVQIETFRHMVEEHQLGFKNFIEAQATFRRWQDSESASQEKLTSQELQPSAAAVQPPHNDNSSCFHGPASPVLICHYKSI